MKKMERYYLSLQIAKCRKQLKNNRQFLSPAQALRIQQDLHEMEGEMEDAARKKHQRKTRREERNAI